MQAIIYVAAFLASFAVGKAIHDGKAPEEAKGSEVQRVEQVQSPSDGQPDNSKDSVAWVLPSLGAL
jgi:hypothetical protein